jgi:hypothetical protein
VDIDFDIGYKTAFTNRLRAHIVKEFLKNMMFMRQQVPSLYHELDAEATRVVQKQSEQPSRKRRLTAGAPKKMLKYVASMRTLLDNIDDVFAYPVDSVVILFGTSLLNPKESYNISFHYNAEACDRAVPIDLKTADLVVRKMLRALICGGNQIFSKLLGVTRMHLVVSMPCTDVPCPGFRPRHSFKIKQPRSKVALPRVNIDLTTSYGGGPQAAVPAPRARPAAAAPLKHIRRHTAGEEGRWLAPAHQPPGHQSDAPAAATAAAAAPLAATAAAPAAAPAAGFRGVFSMISANLGGLMTGQSQSQGHSLTAVADASQARGGASELGSASTGQGGKAKGRRSPDDDDEFYDASDGGGSASDEEMEAEQPEPEEDPNRLLWYTASVKVVGFQPVASREAR